MLFDDGKPLTSGSVILVGQERGLEYRGQVGPDGTFTIASDRGDGAAEGSYLVRIDAREEYIPVKGKSGTRKWQLPFPARYADATASGLTATVGPGENRLDPFRLTAEARKAAPKASKPSKN